MLERPVGTPVLPSLEGKTHARLSYPTLLLPPTGCACSCGTDDGDHRYRGVRCAQTPRASSPLGRALSVGLHRGVPDGHHPVWRALVDGCLPLLHCAGGIWVRPWWLRGTAISPGTLGDAPAWEELGDRTYYRDNRVVYRPAYRLLRGQCA